MRLKHAKDGRQLLIVAAYLGLVGANYFVPAARSPVTFGLSLLFSFWAMTVNHNVIHSSLFENRTFNRWFRLVLSFCALFPVTSVIPSHNLVHHQFDDDGQPDWAAPESVRFRWNLLNLLHFPNVAGPVTFEGTQAWLSVRGRGEYRRQANIESAVAFGVTAFLLVHDFWPGLFYVVFPQLFGARWFLRVNIIQHDGCDTNAEWNHSRNFTSPLLNWVSVNAGYHTIHHNRAGLHWSELPAYHDREVTPRIHPGLVEQSLTWYMVRTYLLRFSRPGLLDTSVYEARAKEVELASRAERLRAAELSSATV